MKRITDDGKTYVKESAHYSIFEIENIDEIRTLFYTDYKGQPISEPTVNSMNLLIAGTSGVHGSGVSLDEVEQGWDDEEEGYGHSVTLLVIHPRLVCLKYGDVEIEKSDIPWLRKVITKSIEALTESQKGNIE